MPFKTRSPQSFVPRRASRTRRCLVELSPAATGTISHGLQIQYLGDFVLRREGGRDESKPHNRREVAATPVQLCKSQGGDDAEGGEVDEEGQGLPLLPAQPGGLDEGVRLLDEGQGGVEVRGLLDESLDGLAEDRFDLRFLGGDDRVREVNEDQFSSSS